MTDTNQTLCTFREWYNTLQSNVRERGIAPEAVLAAPILEMYLANLQAIIRFASKTCPVYIERGGEVVEAVRFGRDWAAAVKDTVGPGVHSAWMADKARKNNFER